MTSRPAKGGSYRELGTPLLDVALGAPPHSTFSTRFIVAEASPASFLPFKVLRRELQRTALHRSKIKLLGGHLSETVHVLYLSALRCLIWRHIALDRASRLSILVTTQRELRGRPCQDIDGQCRITSYANRAQPPRSNLAARDVEEDDGVGHGWTPVSKSRMTDKSKARC
jgi:hypothetical protein